MATSRERPEGCTYALILGIPSEHVHPTKVAHTSLHTYRQRQSGLEYSGHAALKITWPPPLATCTVDRLGAFPSIL